jgi:hypothetical protein
MIKIKLECWWTDNQTLTNRFIKQFVFDFGGFEFVNSKPDYTIIFGRTNWNEIETIKEKTFYFSQEPLWSPNQPKSDIENYCSKIFISDKEDYPQRSEYVESLLPMFYGGRGDVDSREEWDWSKEIVNHNYKKNKKISIVVTNSSSIHSNYLSDPKTSRILYPERVELARNLSDTNLVDIYGTHWQKDGKNIKGEIWNKHLGLDDYQFSICCENSAQKNYISEKFWDAILTDTIPIYLGCINIEELIPSNCFISLNDLQMKDMLIKIEEIEKNSDEIYNSYLPNIQKLKKEFFSNPIYNLWEKIKYEIKSTL